MFDVWMMLVFGVMGYLFSKLGYPLPPLVLALVLGDQAESSFRQAMLVSQGNVGIFWSNWLSGGIMTLGLILALWPLIKAIQGRIRRNIRVTAARTAEAGGNTPVGATSRNPSREKTTMRMLTLRKTMAMMATATCAALALTSQAQAQAWEPQKPVTFVIPAGTGGGADQMARFVQGVIQKHNLMKQPLIVVNKGGGAGAEGFIEMKASQRDPPQADHHPVEPVHHAACHRLALQLEGFAAGRHAGARPVHPLGECRTPYKTAAEYVEAVKRAKTVIQDGRHRLQAGRPDCHGRD